MGTWEMMNLVYLALLGAALVFWFVVQNRQGLGRTVQQMFAWGLIFVGVIAVFGLWQDIRHDILPGQAVFADQGRIELPRAFDGHYYLTLEVNGAPVRFVVDTGASDVVLSRKDALAAGLNLNDLPYTGRAMTANGEVRTAPVRLNHVALGRIVDRNLPASVNDGEMGISLLGMRYLQNWSRIEISGGSMVLTR